MNRTYWIKWAKAAGIRAVKTMAQVAGSMLVIGAFNETAWGIMVQTVLVSGLASVLTSIAGLPEVDVETTEDGAGE